MKLCKHLNTKNICAPLLVLGFLYNFNFLFAGNAQTGKDLSPLYDSAKYCYGNSDFASAILFLDTLLKNKNHLLQDSAPEYYKVYNLLGVCDKRQGDYIKAKEYYLLALKNISDSTLLPGI